MNKKSPDKKLSLSKPTLTSNQFLVQWNMERAELGLPEIKKYQGTSPTNEVNVIFSRATPPLSKETKASKVPQKKKEK